jgi:hypothetical protein
VLNFAGTLPELFWPELAGTLPELVGTFQAYLLDKRNYG